MRTGTHRVPLIPSIAVNVGERTHRFPGAYLLALARRSPAAARLATSLDVSGRLDAFPQLFRLAVERVTEIPRRTAAILDGDEVRDELLVPVVLTLGDEALAPDALALLLEQVATLSADFYRGTGVDLHVVALLPDLEADHDERDAHYTRAYEHLTVLEAAAGPARRNADGNALVAHRWLADCRTGVGAHAGSVDDVLLPIAESLAVRATSAVSRQRDGECRHVLYGLALDRPTCYSAAGYAEIVCDPSVLARFAACRVGVQVAAGALRPAGDVAAAAWMEEQAATCLERLELRTVADTLRRPEPGDEDSSGRERLLRARTRHAGRDRAVGTVLEAARSLIDAKGIPTAMLTLAALEDVRVGDGGLTVHPPVTLAALDVAARRRARSLLGIVRRRDEAAALERDADERDVDAERIADVLTRAAAIRESGSEESSAATDAPDPDAPEGLRSEARALRSRAGQLRDEAERLSALSEAVTEPELEQLYEALVQEGIPATPAVATAAEQAPHAEAASSTTTQADRGATPSTSRSIIGRWLRRMRGREATPRPSGGVPDPVTEPAHRSHLGGPPTSPGSPERPSSSSGVHDGPRDGHLLVEWLRWLAEFRDDLRAVVRAMQRFQADVSSIVEQYDREAEARLDALAGGTMFSHRLLSREQCRRLHVERAAGILEHATAADALPLSRYFRLEEPALAPLESPLNERFDGLDQALDEAARDHFADWLGMSCSDILWNDPEVSARARPEDRLRALIDAAQPLTRPHSEHGGVLEAPVVLLPEPRDAGLESRERTAAAIARIDASLGAHDGQHATRISVRTAVHGFPAFALHQLRPQRQRFRDERGLEPSDDPLPEAALVDESLLALMALGKALGCVGGRDGAIWLGDLRLAADLPQLAERARHTARGAAALRDLRMAVAHAMGGRTEAQSRLLRGLADPQRALTTDERALVEAVLTDLAYGGWPEMLPEPPYGGPELAA